MNKDLFFSAKTWGILMGAPILLNVIVAYFFCRIETSIDYSWYSGIWHGLCAIGNFMLSIFDHSRLIKSSGSSTFYYIGLAVGIIVTAVIISLLRFVIDTVINKYIDRTSSN